MQKNYLLCKTLFKRITSTIITIKESMTMCFKMLIHPILFFMIFVSGCSRFNQWVYKPDINQGNYLSQNEVNKIHQGMTQNEVMSTLGSPMLTDPFGTQTWFYIFRQQVGHEKVKQQTLTLKFNQSGQLIDIKNHIA